MDQFTKFYDRFERWWISDSIQALPAQHGKARLILGICVVFTPLIFVILTTAWFTLPESRPQTAVIMIGHLLVTTSSLALRWSKSILVPGTIFIVFGTAQLLVATSLTGSIVSPVIYAFPVLVVFASTVVEFRVGLWTAVVLLLGAVVLWLPDYPEYSLITEHAPLHLRTMTLGWAMMTAIGVAWLYTVEAKRSESALLAAIDDRERFVAYLSHELRNPLTAIIGAADLLSMRQNDDHTDGLLDALHRSVNGMTQVLDDVLDVSKASAGMLDLQIEPTPTLQLVEGVISEFRPMAETTNIQLDLKYVETEDLYALGSAHRLAQVLRNLLSNSLKFTDPGGRVTLQVRRDQGDTVCFEVNDTGIGIEKHQLKAILLPYRQAKQGSMRGVGLGLPISNLLLDAMGSELRVRSEPGEGSSFSFSLRLAPRGSGDQPTTPAPKHVGPESVSDNAPLRPLQVLLVDDNNDAREVLAELLERLSCEVQTAKDGLEALEMIHIRQPQVLLLDLQMPRLGGVETAIELRRQFSVGEHRPFRLIALTGDVDTQSQLVQDGLFDRVMTKPVGLAQLRDVLREFATVQLPTD